MDIIVLTHSVIKGHNIRIFGTWDDPLFIAAEIGAALNMTNIRQSIENFDASLKRILKLPTKGGMQNHTMLTEAGFYRLILRSKMPDAAQFQLWVCNHLSDLRRNAILTPEQKRQMFTIPTATPANEPQTPVGHCNTNADNVLSTSADCSMAASADCSMTASADDSVASHSAGSKRSIINNGINLGKFHKKSCVYLIQLNETDYKFGVTERIIARMKQHDRDFRKHDLDPKLYKVWKCNTGHIMRKAEKNIKEISSANGTLVFKYGKIEIIETTNPEKVAGAITAYIADKNEKYQLGKGKNTQLQLRGPDSELQTYNANLCSNSDGTHSDNDFERTELDLEFEHERNEHIARLQEIAIKREAQQAQNVIKQQELVTQLKIQESQNELKIQESLERVRLRELDLALEHAKLEVRKLDLQIKLQEKSQTESIPIYTPAQALLGVNPFIRHPVSPLASQPAGQYINPFVNPIVNQSVILHENPTLIPIAPAGQTTSTITDIYADASIEAMFNFIIESPNIETVPANTPVIIPVSTPVIIPVNTPVIIPVNTQPAEPAQPRITKLTRDKRTPADIRRTTLKTSIEQWVANNPPIQYEPVKTYSARRSKAISGTFSATIFTEIVVANGYHKTKSGGQRVWVTSVLNA